MAVELWGLHDKPILAKNLSLWKLIIELDAEPMVTILTSHDTLYDSSHPWSSLISLLQSFEVTRIHHIFRKRNHCVDFLAKKWPLSNDSFILYSQLLFSIMYFLFSDAMGISYPKTFHFVVLFNYITFYPKKKNWIGWVRVKVCLGFVWGEVMCSVVGGMDQKEEERYFSIELWWSSIRLNPLLHCWSVILIVKLRLVSFILVAKKFYSSLAFI